MKATVIYRNKFGTRGEVTLDFPSQRALDKYVDRIYENGGDVIGVTIKDVNKKIYTRKEN